MRLREGPRRRLRLFLGRGGALSVGFAVMALAALGAKPGDTDLVFVAADGGSTRITRAQLLASCAAQTVSVDDPYYEARKTFLACPLEAVLMAGFGRDAEALRASDFLLEARDGYTRPARGVQLFEGGAFLALGEAGRPLGDFDPIDRRQVDPGPYYLVWQGRGRSDPHRYPWPYQLARIREASVDELFPQMLPQGLAPEAPAWRGLRIFQTQCIACHSINRQGGKVGPELNLPRSIVEYRPVDQLKAFIRDPSSFRYTAMPANPGLSDRDLVDLIAYFEAMRQRKHDLGAE